MAKKKDAWGIEVGANALKAIRLVARGEEVTVEDFEVLPFKKVLTTPDLNVDEAVQVQLDQFLSNHSVGRSVVVVSVPGHAAFARFAKLPPVEPKRIPQIVHFEAVQQIPFPIDEVEWDYQVFLDEDSPEVEVGIFAITKQRVQDIIENYSAVGLRVDGLTLSPLAMYNALAYDLRLTEEETGSILIDIGTSSTDIVVVYKDKVWPRTLPIGGNNFTEALVRAFKLSFPKAEKLKREARTSKYARQIFQAMRPVFADLVQEVNRSLGFYQSINREAELGRIIGVGSTFRLPGMTKFLRQQLQMEVVRLDAYKRLNVPDKQAAEFADHALNMATAYGLALQGLELEQVNANLMPRAILKRRLWRAKQPWFGAAAAALVAASTAAGMQYVQAQNTLEEEKAKSDPVVRTAQTTAQELQKEWKAVETGVDPRDQLRNLGRILDYRTVWTGVIGDLDLASQSMGPQAELLDAEYDLIAEVDRSMRRRLYVDQVTIEYVPAGGPAPGDAWRPASELAAAAGRMGAQPAAPGPAVSGPSAAEFPNAPRFTVTLSATTPYGKAPQLLEQTYLRWFRENADRPDRPYRILVDTLKHDLQAMRSPSPGRATGGRPRPGTGGRVMPGTRPGGPGSGAWLPCASVPGPDAGLVYGPDGTPMAPSYSQAGEESPWPGQPGGRSATSAPRSEDLMAEDETLRRLDSNLLPKRPLQDEARESDWRLDLTYVIELRPPYHARLAETGGQPPAPAAPQPEPEPAPSAQAPAQPAAPSEDRG